MSFCLTYVIMNLLWLCMLSYAWMRERFQKNNRRENHQEDQILELTFNFHGALSILTSVFTKKSKKKKKKKERKKGKYRWNEEKEEKKKEENFLFEPPCQKSQF